MTRRMIPFLVTLLGCTAVAAWAADPAQQLPAPSPALAAASAPAPAATSSPESAVPAPQHDLDWLLQPGPASPATPPAVDPLRSALPATCLSDCLASGEDLICCRYICHPIGMNPC